MAIIYKNLENVIIEGDTEEKRFMCGERGLKFFDFEHRNFFFNIYYNYFNYTD